VIIPLATNQKWPPQRLGEHEIKKLNGGGSSPVKLLPKSEPTFDVTRCYVRFRESRSDGYVLFDFAIGEPGMAVELTLPFPAYQEFCRANAITWVTHKQAEYIDYERSKWRFGAPGLID
jgi:phenol/toluene 2-monooxygenase (NADH) P0/A0